MGKACAPGSVSVCASTSAESNPTPLSRAAAAQVGQVDAASLRLLLLHQSADYTHSHGSPPAVRQ